MEKQFKELAHKTYLVGGAIRNELLGIPSADKDFVIEANEEEFRKFFPDAPKVGNEFPVFLIAGDEVALTRTERSNGNGYQDFMLTGVGVSIVDDLSRRDFSINSMAKNIVDGTIIDPFNGKHDLEQGIIRTVNNDFVKDDPLRVYRAARFAAEFEFSIEENTASIIKRDAHYIKNVNPERVYVELKKVYERCKTPSIFFKVLKDIDCLKYHFKPLYVMDKIKAGPVQFHGNNTALQHALNSFDNAKKRAYSFDVALAALFHDTGKGISKKASEGETQHHYQHEIGSYIINKQFVKQHRFTARQNELIVEFARHHMYFHQLEKIKSPLKLVRFYKKIKNKVDDMICAANTDHELNENQLKILANLRITFKETEVDIPVAVQKKGKKSVVQYVELLYVKKYKEIVNG